MDIDKLVDLYNSIAATGAFLLAWYAIHDARKSRSANVKLGAVWSKLHLPVENEAEPTDGVKEASITKEYFDRTGLMFYIVNTGEKAITLYDPFIKSENQTFGVTPFAFKTVGAVGENIVFPYKLDSGEILRGTNITLDDEMFSPETKAEAYLMVKDASGKEYKCLIRHGAPKEEAKFYGWV